MIIISSKVRFKITAVYTALIFIFLYYQPNLVFGFSELVSEREITGISYVKANVGYFYNSDDH